MLDGNGGVRPGRDQATCEGGGGALVRRAATRGFGGSLEAFAGGDGAELGRSSAGRGFSFTVVGSSAMASDLTLSPCVGAIVLACFELGDTECSR